MNTASTITISNWLINPFWYFYLLKRWKLKKTLFGISSFNSISTFKVSFFVLEAVFFMSKAFPLGKNYWVNNPQGVYELSKACTIMNNLDLLLMHVISKLSVQLHNISLSLNWTVKGFFLEWAYFFLLKLICGENNNLKIIFTSVQPI